jgi:Ser/Thr protein kinase RdoA (MazF antagonist)
LEVYEVDVSRARLPFDFEILEEAPGRPLGDFEWRAGRTNDSVEAEIRPLLFELGRFLGRLHRIKTHGYGPVDVRSLASGACECPGSSQAIASGILETWQEYVFLRLDDHVKKCLDLGAISRAEAGQISKLVELVLGSMPDMQPVLLHGDLGNHNVFSDGKTVTAVIDWEDCLCGDPVFDIAFWATFHPEERHRFFLDGYQTERRLPEDFARRFWMYYLRIALSKTVLRDRFGLKDRMGRPPASRRIQQGLAALSRAA